MCHLQILSAAILYLFQDHKYRNGNNTGHRLFPKNLTPISQYSLPILTQNIVLGHAEHSAKAHNLSAVYVDN